MAGVKTRKVRAATDIPDLAISVTKKKGHLPVLISYIPNYGENDEEDIITCTTTNISEKEYKRWKKASDLERLQIACKALEDFIRLEEMHRE